MMETAIHKDTISFLYLLNHFTHIHFPVYFNVVRKEAKTTALSDDDKFQQDVAFLKELRKKSESLTGYSLYMWWFPTEIQKVLEMLMSRKPLDADVGGLLTLIMFAGIDFDDDKFFEMQVIRKAFLPKDKVGTNNLLFESQQNLSVLLFGLTLDDVRKTSLVSFLPPVLTFFSFLQGTRFLESVRECCGNRKSLVNVVLKQNYQKPNPSTLKMLRYVAVEVLFRLSMMFLKKNETALLDSIETVGGDLKDEHKRKIEKLLHTMYPPPSQVTQKQEFKRFEQWLGHNLFVTSIMISSKTVRNKPQFSKAIPELQWKEFVSEQVEMGHEPPNLHSLLYATTYKAETETCKSQQTESPKKRKETTGELFGMSCLLCKFI